MRPYVGHDNRLAGGSLVKTQRTLQRLQPYSLPTSLPLSKQKADIWLTASLRFLESLNDTDFKARISMDSPVAGFVPIGAARMAAAAVPVPQIAAFFIFAGELSGF